MPASTTSMCEAIVPVADPDACLGWAGVIEGVGERFLEAVRSELHSRREVPLLPSDDHRAQAGIARTLDHRGKAAKGRLGGERGVLLVRADAEQAAQLERRWRGADADEP